MFAPFVHFLHCLCQDNKDVEHGIAKNVVRMIKADVIESLDAPVEELSEFKTFLWEHECGFNEDAFKTNRYLRVIRWPLVTKETMFCKTYVVILRGLLARLGWKSYRLDRVYSWIHSSRSLSCYKFLRHARQRNKYQYVSHDPKMNRFSIAAPPAT